MAKKNAWNTVTPLSKTAAMILFIALPFIGFYLGMRYQNILTASNAPFTTTQERADSKPELVTHTFYNNYLACLTNHFRHPTGTPTQDCPFETNSDVTQNFAEHIQKNAGGDPILCAQNSPLSIKTEDARVNGDTATVTVHEIFGISTQEVIVSLRKSDDDWKIDDVMCR